MSWWLSRAQNISEFIHKIFQCSSSCKNISLEVLTLEKYLCLVCYCWCWHVCPDSVLQTNWLSERCCSTVQCTVYSVQCVTGGVSSAGGQYSGHRGHLSTSSCDQWERSEWSHRALLHHLPVTPHLRDYPWCDGRIDPVNATSSIFSRIRIICSMWHKFYWLQNEIDSIRTSVHHLQSLVLDTR